MNHVDPASPLPAPLPPARGVPPARPAPIALQVAKMLGYFFALTVGLKVLEEVIAAFAQSRPVGNLVRVSRLMESILDVTKNLDELLVTLFTLAIAFLLILPVSWVLKITKGDEREPSLTQTLIVLSMIVAAVTLLIQDSLARSFGLVGVVAAVRYRNTLKDSKDAVYVFLALAIGMACGLHAYPVAALLSFFECAVLFGLWIYSRREGPTEASLLERLRLAEKRGTRTPEQALAWLTPEARERLEEDLEAQSRYITMASVISRKDGKRPNAAITVKLSGTGAARDRVNAEMEAHGGEWVLLGAEETNGATTLEYLGRVSRKKTPPLKFIERLQQAHPEVQHVTFRSLRKMVADKIEVGPGHVAAPIEPDAEAPAAKVNGSKLHAPA